MFSDLSPQSERSAGTDLDMTQMGMVGTGTMIPQLPALLWRSESFPNMRPMRPAKEILHCKKVLKTSLLPQHYDMLLRLNFTQTDF